MKKPGIAIIHPLLAVGGGSQARALWLATAAKKDYSVALISMGPVDIPALNAFYGTDLDPEEVEVVSIPIPLMLKKRGDALRGYRLARYCKKTKSLFPIMISSYNVMDFGKKGIQFIADFSFDDAARRRLDQALGGIHGLFYKKSLFRQWYLYLGKLLSGESRKGWRQNITVANSQWSQALLKTTYGLESTVIYPPVFGRFPDRPWDQRENGFVAVGRLEPEKRFEFLIQILNEVRAKGFDVHFHIVGKIEDTYYCRSIQRLCARYQDWVSLEGLLIGQKKDEFFSRHKFGISGRWFEPFGIAVAEMTKAGNIVWVPNGGGQVEIVKHNLLTFHNKDEAVTKIIQVLIHRALQEELLAHLRIQANKFAIERFIAESQSLLEKFLLERT